MQTSRLTSTLRRLIWRDPAARLVETTAGSSCGVMPTAMASEKSRASRNGLWSSTLMTKIEVVRAPATLTSSIEKRRRPTWNSVSSWWVLSPVAMAPNSVCDPVATTTPRPLPAWTTVPISAHPESSARAAGLVHRRRSSSPPAGTRPSAPTRRTRAGRRRRRRMSAGTTSPRLSSTTSPGTSEVTSTRPNAPPRRTTASWVTCEWSEAAAFSARYSLTKPSPTETTTMKPMMTASPCSPTKYDAVAATSSRPSRGESSWCHRTVRTRAWWVAIAFGP